MDALDAEALRARFPWFTVDDATIGAFEADAGLVRPEAGGTRCDTALPVHAVPSCATTSHVRGIAEDATGVSVATATGVERASAVVVAAGAWTAALLPELAPRLTVTRQVQAWIAPRPGVDVSAMPCWLSTAGRADGRSMASRPTRWPPAQRPEDHPSRMPKVALHGSDEIVDPHLGAGPVNDADTECLCRAYHEVAPALVGQPIAAATCLYTMSPDGHFLVGTRTGARRTHFAAGLSGHGFKLAPALGDALVDLAIHGRTELPIGFLAPGRFG